jgi:hypothetical protein
MVGGFAVTAMEGVSLMLHAVNIEPTPRPCDPAAHAESVACAAFERLLELGRARGERKLGKRQWLKTFARAQAAAAGLYREGITEADWIAATLASLTRSGVARGPGGGWD